VFESSSDINVGIEAEETVEIFNRAGMKAFRYRTLISDDDSNTEYNETLNALYKME
jgi:hypothetical protein